MDFRYETERKRCWRRFPSSYRVAGGREHLRRDPWRSWFERHRPRIGIEASSMTVGQFNRLTRVLSPGPIEALMPTERLVERQRAVKDSRRSKSFGRPHEGCRPSREALPNWSARGARNWRSRPTSTWRSGPAGSSGRHSRRSSLRGENSARPHARPGSRRLEEGDGVVLDFGGVYDGYCVDLTRTLPVGAAARGLLRVAAAVLEAHDAAIAAVKPGARPSEIDARGAGSPCPSRAGRGVRARNGPRAGAGGPRGSKDLEASSRRCRTSRSCRDGVHHRARSLRCRAGRRPDRGRRAGRRGRLRSPNGRADRGNGSFRLLRRNESRQRSDCVSGG